MKPVTLAAARFRPLFPELIMALARGHQGALRSVDKRIATKLAANAEASARYAVEGMIINRRESGHYRLGKRYASLGDADMPASTATLC